MNLLNLLALELTNCQGIEFLNVKDFAGLCDLPIQLFNLLWKGFLILFLLGGELLDDLLLFSFLLLELGFALLELL